jgi:hypothetical protein
LLTLRRPRNRVLPGLRTPEFVHKLLAAPLNHTHAVVIVAAALAVGAAFVLPGARFDSNPLNLQDPKVESVVTYKDLLAQHGSSPWSVVTLAENAHEAEQIAAKLKSIATVDSVETVEQFVPADQDAKLAVIGDLALTLGLDLDSTSPTAAPSSDDTLGALHTLDAALASHRGNPTGTAEAAAADLRTELGLLLSQLDTAAREELTQRLAKVEHALLASLPGRIATLVESLNAEPIGLESLPDEVRHRWVDPAGRYRVEIIPREDLEDPKALHRFIRDVRSVLPDATGSPIIYMEASDAVVRAFAQAFTYALLAISLILWVSMDRNIDVVLVLAPLLLAAMLTGAAVVLLGIPFNFANIIALPLLLGMGVDNGIHMVHRFRTAPPEDGVMLKTSTATAIGLSALTNTSAFGSLAVSPHTGTASMGVLLTVGILLTLACTMFILPSLMALLCKRPATQE